MSARLSHKPSTTIAVDRIEDRVAHVDWRAIRAELEIHGAATSGILLTEAECKEQAASYENAGPFRSRVVMARQGFGRGEYQYFAYPLPPLVQALRQALYERLAPIANAWHTALSLPAGFPERHKDYIDLCRQAGQTKPTPLILKYAEGDYNCLHQDLYSELIFPFQAAFLLSRPGADFTGGEFVLTEQRPRMQSRAEAVPLRQGECVIFPVRHRPVRGTRGIYRTAMRHGVSRIRSGQRFTMGIIFHDGA